MNKTYKSVWNETTGTWVAVSELEKGRSKIIAMRRFGTLGFTHDATRSFTSLW